MPDLLKIAIVALALVFAFIILLEASTVAALVALAGFCVGVMLAFAFAR